MRITRRVVDDDSTFAINSAMDNNSSHQNGEGGGGPGPSGISSNLNSSNQTGGGGMNNKQMGDNQGISGGVGGGGHQYTMPGVLHYIQHEFSRLEMERSQWDIDRAELQVKQIKI